MLPHGERDGVAKSGAKHCCEQVGKNNVLFTHAADVRQEVCVLAKYISQGGSSGLGIKAVSDSSILSCSCI